MQFHAHVPTFTGMPPTGIVKDCEGMTSVYVLSPCFCPLPLNAPLYRRFSAALPEMFAEKYLMS